MLYFLALFCLSTSPNFAKLNQMPAEVLGFWRLAIAATILILIQLFHKKFEWVPLNRKTVWIYISGFFFFLHLWTYKYAAKHTLVSNTMVLFASNPIWASIGSRFFFKEHISTRIYLAYVVALAGIIYLVSNSMKLDPDLMAGNISALISAIFYACYMLTGKKARAHHSNQVYATFQYLTCAAFFLLISLIGGHELMRGYSGLSWVAVIGLIALPTFLGHYLLTHLVKTMNMAVLTCGKLIEPVIASIIAYFVFNEHLSDSITISFLLTAISVIILFWPQIVIYLNKRYKGTKGIHR